MYKIIFAHYVECTVKKCLYKIGVFGKKNLFITVLGQF